MWASVPPSKWSQHREQSLRRAVTKEKEKKNSSGLNNYSLFGSSFYDLISFNIKLYTVVCLSFFHLDTAQNDALLMLWLCTLFFCRGRESELTNESVLPVTGKEEKGEGDRSIVPWMKNGCANIKCMHFDITSVSFWVESKWKKHKHITYTFNIFIRWHAKGVEASKQKVKFFFSWAITTCFQFVAIWINKSSAIPRYCLNLICVCLSVWIIVLKECVDPKSNFSLFPRWSHNFSYRDFPQTYTSY